jgi:hypothetical protein
MDQAEIHSVFEIVAPLPGSDAGRNQERSGSEGFGTRSRVSCDGRRFRLLIAGQHGGTGKEKLHAKGP